MVFSLGDDSGFDTDQQVANGHLGACEGPWALVEYSRRDLSPELDALIRTSPEAAAGLPAGRFRAWVDRLWVIQETACDGMGEAPWRFRWARFALPILRARG